MQQTRASLQAIARSHALVAERTGQLAAKQQQYLLAAADLEVVYEEEKRQAAMLGFRIKKLQSTLPHAGGQMGSGSMDSNGLAPPELRRAGGSRAEDLANHPRTDPGPHRGSAQALAALSTTAAWPAPSFALAVRSHQAGSDSLDRPSEAWW